MVDRTGISFPFGVSTLVEDVDNNNNNANANNNNNDNNNSGRWQMHEGKLKARAQRQRPLCPREYALQKERTHSYPWFHGF